MKENKKRIMVYFILMLVFLIFGFYGKSCFKNGFGKYGKVKQVLDPIALEFNILDDVKRLTDIRADVIKGELVVTYITANNKKEKYKYEYVENNGLQYITNKDEYNTGKWSFIAMEMANAVYHANGGKGSIFTDYDVSTFKSTTVEDGLIYDDSSKTVTINLSANVVKNIAGKYKSLKDNSYAKDEDLKTFANDLSVNSFFIFEKDDIKIYVKNESKYYNIYAKITEENANRVNLSITNMVKILKPEVYKTIKIENDFVTFEVESSAYETLLNAPFSEANVFDSNDTIFQFKLKK